MHIRAALIIFLAVTLTGCTNQNVHETARILVGTHGVSPASELGLTVDENLRVLDLDSQGAAYLAGVQVGDILIDLTLIELNENPPVQSDHIAVTSTEEPSPTPTVESIPTATLPPEADISSVEVRPHADSVATESVAPVADLNEPVPFTDRDKVKSLISLGGTIKLKLDRGGNIVELTFKTTPRAPRPDAPTPTPILPPQDYF